MRLIRSKIGRPVAAQIVPLDDHFELRPYKTVYDEEDSRRMEITTRLIALMRDFVESRGGRFLVVEGVYKPVLDPRWQRRIVRQYGDVFDCDRVSRTLDEFCRERGIEFLSLSRLVRERDLAVSDLMHADDTVHLNREGIQFYAGAVVDKLRSLEWIERPAEREGEATQNRSESTPFHDGN